MGELGELLELLHDAHARVSTFQCEYQEHNRAPAGDTLVVRASGAGKPRLRWAGAGPWRDELLITRRIWFAHPDRLRVELTDDDGELVRMGVRSGTEWWWWDEISGARSGSTAPAQGGPGTLPRLLSPPLIEAYRLVPMMRFEPTGPGERAGRSVIGARAFPRRQPASRGELAYEFEFDAEHGSVLRRAEFESGLLAREVEARQVAYGAEIEDECFVFRSPDGEAG